MRSLPSVFCLCGLLLPAGCERPSPSEDASLPGDVDVTSDSDEDRVDRPDAEESERADSDEDGDAEVDARGDADADLTSFPCDRPIDFPPFRPATIPLDGQVLFPVGIDGDPGPFHLVVDTGAARTLLDGRYLSDVDGGVADVSIDFGEGLVLREYEVMVGDLSEAVEHLGVELLGLIGQDLFGRFYFGLDYVTPSVTMGAGIPDAPPPGYASDEGIDVPYVLEQGLPIVDAAVDGVATRLIADTGSGVTIVVESSVSPEVLDAGIEGYVWYTGYGSDPGTVVRLPSFSVGEATVEDSWAVVVPDDHHLADIFDLLGVHAQGFVGFPFYRRFFIPVIGCEERYVLFPVRNLDHVDRHEWDRVGVEIMRDGSDTVVDMVYVPSDAADAGVTPGDVLVAVNGTPTAGRPLDDVRRSLRGTPSDVRALSLLRDSLPVDVTVAVDRLLPPLE